jgi:hypothetical protein
MTFGKATALTAGLVGAMAFGVWVGPHLTNRGDKTKDATSVHATEPAASSASATKTTTAPRPRTPVARGDATTAAAAPNAANNTAVPLSAPQLHKRLKPLLKPGADMTIVSDGFRNAEDFAATVHASKNTNVPFMILKHQVVDERKSLANAIRASKPDANASLEADLARSEARSDLASLN